MPRVAVRRGDEEWQQNLKFITLMKNTDKKVRVA
jgi:hypothetical protein